MKKGYSLLLLALLLITVNALSQTAYEKLYMKGYNPSDFESINFDGTGRTLISGSSNTAFDLSTKI